jgi:hypothetical protein
MSRQIILTASIALLSLMGSSVADTPQAQLQPPAAFQKIADSKARSSALFTEASRVLQHPRCLNCHPAQRLPTQGEDLHPHVPSIEIGPENKGTKALPCSSCHTNDNVPTLGTRLQSIPGTSGWALAPASMAWQGLSKGETCAQLKDPARNGNRTLAQIGKHMAEDHLVGWAWHPGAGRAPSPGTQAAFGALIKAWIETGAHCPSP